MFFSRHTLSVFSVLVTGCLVAAAPAHANDTSSTDIANEQHNMVTTSADHGIHPVSPQQHDATAAPSSGSNAATSPTGQTATPLPVPKRLSAQERWNKMTREDRAALIAEWENLDEVTRPVFLVFRDNTIEKNLRPTAAQENLSSQPAAQPIQP